MPFQMNQKLFNYFRVCGTDTGGSRYLPFRSGEPVLLLRGEENEEYYIAEHKLREIVENPPTQVVLHNTPVTLTYEDRRKTCIRLVLRFGVDRSKLRFV